MKLTITLLACAILITFTILPATPATAGKKLVNLKVLSPSLGKKVGKGMKHLTKGLGVKCIACHVKGKMEKEDVPAKGYSRTFLKTVIEHPEQRKAALETLLKDMKLEKAKDEARIWKAFDSWKKK